MTDRWIPSSLRSRGRQEQSAEQSMGSCCHPYSQLSAPQQTLKQQPPKITKPQWKEGPLFNKFGLKPEMVRTQRCHRRGHKQPADIRTAMKKLPGYVALRQEGGRDLDGDQAEGG